MKKRYIIIFALLLCITFNIIGVNDTMAWFVSGGTLGSDEYSAAKVEYLPPLQPTSEQQAIYGSLSQSSTATETVFLIPGDEIVKPFASNSVGMLSLENFSTVATNVRAVVDFEFITKNLDGTITVDTMADFSWKQLKQSSESATDTYQFGKTANIGTAPGTPVHMGLAEITFANKTISETTIPNYTPVANATKYKWEKIPPPSTPSPTEQISFANAWELKIADNNSVPPITAGGRGVYNVITSLKIVGSHPQVEYQNDFNKYFSENYAGKQIRITIKYYAKQLAGMEWAMFNRQMLNITP